MRKIGWITWVLVLMHSSVLAQRLTSRKAFFTDTTIIEATLTTDFNKLTNEKKNPVFQPARFTWHKADSAGDVTEPIRVKLRGYYRRSFCSFASMLFDFSDSTERSRLENLKELKVVVPCEWGPDDEQLVLKEYLLYRIYQLFTPLSYRQRLIRFRFVDESGNMKPYRQYGFALEPVDDVAKRNGFKEDEERKVLSEQTNRLHTTMVSIFEYMIGNTDWAIPPQHNIKLLVPKDSAKVPPYIIPHDFDHSGAVNAIYAEPLPTMGIKKVTDRKYLGFKRTMAELNPILAQFIDKEAVIYKMIADFRLLSKFSKDEMTAFFKGFFVEIKDEATVKKIFIDGARAK